MQAEAQERGQRTWRDATGKFSVKAKLLRKDKSTVTLLTDDGREVSVPLGRLSRQDRAYLRGGDEVTKKKATPAATSQAIDQALKGRPQPAGEVELADLRKLLQVPVFIDRRALERIGLTVDNPVDLTGGHDSFQEQLDAALDPLDLAWCATQTVLVITTKEGIHNHTAAKFYRIPTPKGAFNRGGGGTAMFDSTSVIRNVQQIAPDSWDVMGGAGTVYPLVVPVYLVRQTPPIHRQLAKALGRQPAPHQYGHPFDLQSVTVSAGNNTLEDVIKSVASQLGSDVEFSASLADIGVKPSGGRINVDLKNVSAKDALDLILSQFDCTWVEENEKLIVHSKDFAEENLSTQRIASNLGPMMGDDRFINAIQITVAPDTWEVLGGEGQIRVSRPGLYIVRQGQPAMREVEQFMRDLKALR
jgi:hypothetical protein